MAVSRWIGQCLAASGYLSTFIAPALLVLGIEVDKPLLAFGAVLVLYPLARAVFGEIGESPASWLEATSTFLHQLPRVYVACLPVALFWLPVRHRGVAVDDAQFLLSAGVSLWITLVLSTCVAHELIHRRSDADARLGRWLAAMAGYPLLAFEHLAHHLRAGDVARAEAAATEESVWAYAARRQCIVLRAAIDLVLGRAGSERARRALIESCAVTMLCVAAYVAGLGWRGGVLYVGTALAVAFGFHAITYLQHWGLSVEQVHGATPQPLAWEDSCRFQAWVTLNVSCHQAHHRDARRPFYLLVPERGSPRQPAGYLILLLLSLAPPLWRRLMVPVLDAWRQDPTQLPTQGRRLTCFRRVGAEAR